MIIAGYKDFKISIFHQSAVKLWLKENEEITEMAERWASLSVLLFLLHLLVIKAKFCANKHSDRVGRKPRYQADVLCSITCHDTSDWNDFCCVMHETRIRDAILDLEQEGHFVSNMKAKYPHLLHLLCCYVVVVISVQILDLTTSDTPAEYVRK